MFSELALRRLWFRVPSDPTGAHHELDFRVGGREIARGRFAVAGKAELIEYRSRFVDLQPSERIVHDYESLLDGVLRWVSLVTVELDLEPGGTRLRHTEQYVMVTSTADGKPEVDHLIGGRRLQLNVALPNALDRLATKSRP